jgi:hypothetical protein
VLTVSVAEEGLAPWTMRIAFPLTTLAHLFGHGEKPPIARTRVGPADPLSQPFADMPLPVSALLVDVALPLSTISSLEVGRSCPCRSPATFRCASANERSRTERLARSMTGSPSRSPTLPDFARPHAFERGTP